MSRIRVSASASPVDLKVMIPRKNYEDLRAIASIKRISIAQLVQSITERYLDTMYANVNTKDKTQNDES